MKALRTLMILFALALMCLPAPSAAAAEKPFKLDICAMPEHESFIFWYAKEQGWDKDEGWISRSISSRPAWINEALRQAMGRGRHGHGPHPRGRARYNTYLIGIASDESWVSRHGAARQSRPQGEGLERVSEPPRLSRNREDKTFLYTQSSSQHFGMAEPATLSQPAGPSVKPCSSTTSSSWACSSNPTRAVFAGPGQGLYPTTSDVGRHPH
ncbi:MAG: hypothetical protein ACLSAH_21080 [Bilophila wadsworthia]